MTEEETIRRLKRRPFNDISQAMVGIVSNKTVVGQVETIKQMKKVLEEYGWTNSEYVDALMGLPDDVKLV